MAMIEDLYLKKLNLLKKFENKINVFLNSLKIHYTFSNNTKIIESAIIYLNKILVADAKNLSIIENSVLIYNLLEVIYKTFATIINSTVTNTINNIVNSTINNTEQYKIYTIQYQQLLKNIQIIDNDLEYLMSKQMYNDYFEQDPQNIIDNFCKFTKLFKVYTYSLEIYKLVTKKLLYTYKTDIQIYTSIINENEKMKSFIISVPNETLLKYKIPLANYSTYIKHNPHLNTFGLVPVSNLMSQQDINILLFANTQYDLHTNCINKKYDLVIITKYLNRGINYSVLDLLNYTKSTNFNLHTNNDDGINVTTVQRYNNIQYIDVIKNSVDFKIKYDYVIQSKENTYMLILEEIYPGKYHILSNTFSTYITYYVKKVCAKEFIKFVNSKYGDRTRIDNYNAIINKGILQNMFSSNKYDIKQLEEKSMTYDPGELRFNIYTEIINKYTQLNTKPIKTIFAFSKLLHNKEFIKVFETLLSTQYNTLLQKNTQIYIQNNISIAEIYTSFIYDLNTYERDFKKNLHDNFINKIISILNQDIFVQDDTNAQLAQIFNKIIKETLFIVISNDKNIFQSLNYKLYLLK